MSNSKGSNAWSIGKTDRFKITAEDKKNKDYANVAPSTYERTLANKNKEPTWSMGAKLQDIDKRHSPSPNAYNIPSKVVENQGKSMGQKLKPGEIGGKTLAPGPGAYDQEKLKKKNLQYSMASKLNDQRTLNVPGPGTYEKNTTQTKESVKQSKFGTGQRSQMENPNAKKVPGPGEHSPEFSHLKKSAPNYGFGSETRNSGTNLKHNFPGPGGYTIDGLVGKDGQKNSMHATINYSPERKENDYKPGPANYNPDPLKNKHKSPDYKLGSSTRLDLGFQKRQLFQQDPGAYQPDFKVTKNASSQWKFGTEGRKGLVNRDAPNFPGSGQYPFKSMIQEGPRYGMSAKLTNDLNPMKNNPGPGQYNLQDRNNQNFRNTQKYGIGTSQRIQMANPNGGKTPGPGNYQSSLVDKNAAPRFGFGSGGRAVMGSVMNNVPGPGTYKPLEFVGKEATSQSIHAKLSYKPIENTGGKTPGPGTYEGNLQRNKRTAPAYSPGKEQRVAPGIVSTTKTPGADTYNPTNSFVQKSSAKWGFGSEVRKGIPSKSISPGPGNYQIKAVAFDSEKPKFFMGEKLKPARETTVVPGAGTYDPAHENTKKQTPQFSMKAKLGSSLENKNKGPGPGNYEFEAKNKDKAPAYGFGSSTRKDMKKLDVPGAGSYRIPTTIGDVASYAMPNRSDQYKYV